MRNLYRVSHTKHDLRELTNVTAFAIDQNKEHRFYCVWNRGVARCSVDYTDEDYEQLFPVIEELLPKSAGYENIIAIDHLSLTDELFLAASTGSVWSYNLTTGVAEEVTHCEHGILAMQWSPDQEVVVFVDGQLNVVTMIGREYEPVNEVQLKDDTFGDRSFMSVGWGKKETQFHGSEGKAAAKKKPDPNPAADESEGNPTDPAYTEITSTSVYISWRADGEYFAVTYMAPFGHRAFKVFNKEGALQYTSEKCRGLYGGLAWRPSGQWIAVAQEQDDKCVIALFEKNGLRHREIPLEVNPRLDQSVERLCWSPDSDVLAVYWVDEEKCVSYLYLYVMGNYHWYLKQSFIYKDYRSVVGLQWDHRHSAGKTLHVLTSEETQYERIRFDFRVDRSVGCGADDEAMVAVIDGKRLLLSSFRRAVIPPPMCGYTLERKHPINAVGFIRTPGRWISTRQDVGTNAFFTIDLSGEITLYDIVTDGGSFSGVKELFKIKKFLKPDRDRHWMWLNADHLVFARDGHCTVLYIEPANTGRQPKEDIQLEYEGATVGCIEASGPEQVLVELSSGRLVEVDGFTFDKGIRRKKTAREHSTLPGFCELLYVDRQHPERTVFALAPNRRSLYRDGTLLASDVTSALLTEAYLLCTTISELKFVRLGHPAVAGVPFVENRRVERGSKLVAVVPKASRTVFQLPRGNLEAINPRVLSLCLIAHHLDALEYFEAFDIMRKERINLNLLVDHDPARFLEHLASHFLAQITNVTWLNLFITDLANQDACRTYESNYPDWEKRTFADASGYTVGEKVRFCCERLLAAMDPEPTVLTLPKITCHVKQGQLEKALALIWTLKKQQQSSSNAAEDALHYLLYLVEVNVLYDVALGMYDFGLVLFVATKSQKDPKEYLPFLNELKRMDEDYRKYRIDCHLKRYDRALEHIARYDSDEARFEEVLALVANHRLYAAAVRCYRNCSNREYYRRVCALYGDHLRKTGKHADASLMYERAGDLEQAMMSAHHASDWQRVVRLSVEGSLPVEAILRSLVPALLEAGEFDAAAAVANDHLKDTRLAVDCLLKNHQYKSALMLATAEAELRDKVKSHLHEYLGVLEGTFVTETDTFLHRKQRLAVVRKERSRKRTAVDEDGDGDADCGDCDLFSDHSTVASTRHTASSGRSGKSHRSSKNRRKHERKLFNLKEGNQFEDIALIDALHSMVMLVCGVDRQRHVRSVCEVAVQFHFDDEAARIQQKYEALFKLIGYSLDAIWIPEMIVPGTAGSIGGNDRTGAGDTEDGASSSAESTTSIPTPTNLAQEQEAQRYALIKPHQRYKPEIKSILWQWDMLKVEKP